MGHLPDTDTVKRLALGDLESELAATRQILARLPENHFDWRPHDRSFSLGALGAHLANLLMWLLLTIQENEFDMASAPSERETPRTVPNLLAEYDRLAVSLKTAIDDLTVDDLLADWTLRHGDRIIFTQPRGTVLRSFGLSHMAHHRGQLTVYLRMLDVPLPQVYGPTADEPGG